MKCSLTILAQQIILSLICCFIVLGCNVVQSHADIFFEEKFETDLTDWIVDNDIWEIGTPTAGPSGCAEGLQCVGTVLAGNYPAYTDSRLISPTMQLPAISGSEELYLRFQHWFSYSDSDAGHVQISVLDEVRGEWSSWSDLRDPIVGISSVWKFRGQYTYLNLKYTG